MTSTERLGMAYIKETDVISTDMKDKINTALTKVDTSVGLVICTSTTRPVAPDLFPGIQIYESDTRRRYVNPTALNNGWQLVAGDTVDSIGGGMVRAVRPARPFGLDTNHSAFPSVCVLLNGEVLLVYRQGTDHVASRDGVIRLSRSLDQGHTWTTPTTIATGSPAGTDLRDPCVSLSRDGLTVYLSYFKGTAALTAAGVFFRKSTDNGVTWSSEVRIDSLPYSASSAPVVELDTGVLVMPFYGRFGAETWDSVWTSKSNDGGTTWATQVRILNGQTATDHRQEPYIALLGQIAVMGYRHGTATSIGMSVSVDNTANWSGASLKFAGTGRPNVFWTNDKTVSCVYRSTSYGNDAVIRSSKDGGTNWTPERLVDPGRTAAGWMTYSGTDRLTRGINICALAQESSSTSSRLYLTCIGEAGGTTPFGVIPTDADAAASNLDMVIFGTVFDQVDGALEQPWTIGGGAVTVSNGEVRSSSFDAVADLIRVFTGVNDMTVEADIYNGGSASPQSGSAIIFRMIDGATYLMFTIETGGTIARIYKVVGGTPTQIATQQAMTNTLPFDTYNTYRVHARRLNIMCYLNDKLVIEGQMSGGDWTTFSTGTFAGVKLNSQGDTTHKCRRFIVRR